MHQAAEPAGARGRPPALVADELSTSTHKKKNSSPITSLHTVPPLQIKIRSKRRVHDTRISYSPTTAGQGEIGRGEAGTLLP